MKYMFGCVQRNAAQFARWSDMQNHKEVSVHRFITLNRPLGRQWTAASEEKSTSAP